MNMLANPGNPGNPNPNNNGVYTVSLNPTMSSLNIVPRQVVTPATVRSPEVKQHQCQYCNKTFSSRYNVARHEKICKLNSNNIAQQQLQQQQQQQQQTNTQQKDASKSYHCLFCYKSFATQEGAARHLKKCNKPQLQQQQQQQQQVQTKPLVYHGHGKRVHICKYCAKEFSTKWNVIRHEKLFHNPCDPIVVSQPVTNGVLMTQGPPPPLGKPERYCRFCGNYFSSKYNAIRHEKICTRINSNNNNTEQQQQQQPVQQIQQKSIQVSAVTTPVMTLAPAPQQQQQQPQQQQQVNQQQQVTQQVNQQQQQQIPNSLQQQQSFINKQQVNLQNNQQLLPQQTMVLIEPQPSTPFHVCKFCNKQLGTRCDPIAPVAISGQHMLGGTQLITPVMASLPQLALVPQIGDSTLHSHPILQQQIQEKPQQQIIQQHQVQHLQQPQQQQQQHLPQIQQQQQRRVQQPQQQIQTNQQQQQQQQVERAHCCKYCDKRFATKWYLDQHEKIHTGEADMCKQCGKYFVTRWHLDKHMKVHMQGVSPGNSPSASNKKVKKDQQQQPSITLPSNQVFRFAQQPSSGVTTTTGIRQITPLMSMAVTSEAEQQEQRTTRPVSAPYILTSDRGSYFVPASELPPVNQTIAPPPSSQETSKGDIPSNITYSMS